MSALVKPRPLVAEPYKPRYLKQVQLMQLFKLLHDYRKFPHFSLRDEIVEWIDKLIEENRK